MGRSKIAITLDDELLAKVDDLVANRQFPNRSPWLSRVNRSELAFR